jgi:hypothetical protein
MNLIIDDRDGHGDPEEIYAYIAIDKDGKSGILAEITQLGLTAFVGATVDDVNRWKPIVDRMRNDIKKIPGKKIQLIRYKAEEVIDG